MNHAPRDRPVDAPPTQVGGERDGETADAGAMDDEGDEASDEPRVHERGA